MKLSEPLHYFIKAGVKQRLLVDRMVEHYKQQLMKSQGDRASVAIKVHQRIDILISNGLNNANDPDAKKVVCRSGCAHCCHMETGVTFGEVQLLARVIKDKQIPVDTERLQRQTQRPNGVWAELQVADRQCVLLDHETKRCVVYEHRPTVCRNHHVITPPENCDGRGPIIKWFNPEAEVLMSVDHNINDSGVLSDLLHSMFTKR